MKKTLMHWDNISQDQWISQAKKLLERRIIKQMGCWGWKGKLTKYGYGDIAIGGKKHAKHMNASRISYLVYKGPIPEGLHVLHTCDVRSCCAPDHLFLGTHKDNMQDMIEKGRDKRLKGSDCPWAQLTEEKVLAIIDDFKSGMNAAQVAQKYTITREHARDIKCGRKWPHIGDRTGIEKIEPNKKILNESLVHEIKQKFANGSRIVDICNEYGFSRSTVDDIKKNRTWKHIKLN